MILEHRKTLRGKYEIELVTESDGSVSIVQWTNGRLTAKAVGYDRESGYVRFVNTIQMAKVIDGINYRRVEG